MKFCYKNYTLFILDDSNYVLNSTDNPAPYGIEHFDRMFDSHSTSAASQHGIRVIKDDVEIASAIICEIGGATTVHDHSAVISNESILICCSDKVYSLSLPDLQINWKKRLDLATCLAIYSFKGDFIIHGELQITRIDNMGNEIWSFSAKDIFVTADGKESIEITGDAIKVRDWNGDEFTLNENGQVIM